MDCPKCPGAPLEEKQHAEDLLVDLCGVCGGAWADRGEVVRFVGRYDLLERGLPMGEPSPTHHPCPRCGKLMDRVLLADAALEFEVCGACGGTWFDGREVQALRAHLARLAAPPPPPAAGPRPRWHYALPVLLGVLATAGMWARLKKAPSPPAPAPAPRRAAAPAPAPSAFADAEPVGARLSGALAERRARDSAETLEAAAGAFRAQESFDAGPGPIVSGAFPGPCAMVETFAGPELRAGPGELVEFRGVFRERDSVKVAMVGNGPVEPVEVADWVSERMLVRLPRWLRPGRYRLNVNCYYDGQVYSRGAQDLRVTDTPAPRAQSPVLPELPLQLSGDPGEMMGAGAAMMVLRRFKDAYRAFGAAADGYHARDDLRREVPARRERIAAAAAAAMLPEAQAERERIAQLYYRAARVASSPEEARKMELAYGELGFELARDARERGDLTEAERVYGSQQEIFKRHEQKLLEAMAVQGLAQIAGLRGERLEAQTRFLKAAELFGEARHPAGVEACERAALDLKRALAR